MSDLIKIYTDRIEILEDLHAKSDTQKEINRLSEKLGCYRSFLQDLKQANVDEQSEKAALCQGIGGSALPKGFKVYKCSDCGEINVKRDNGEVRVGFCDECEHPLWN